MTTPNSGYSPSKGEVPESLQKLLTITSPASTTANASNNNEKPVPSLRPPPFTSAAPSGDGGDLLSRLEAFLPQMAQANANLPADVAASSTIDVIEQEKPTDNALLKEVKTTTTTTTMKQSEKSDCGRKQKTTERVKNMKKQIIEEDDGEKEGKTQEQGTVEMDIFVDNSFGQLVPSQDMAEQKGEKEINSLIREIKE